MLMPSLGGIAEAFQDRNFRRYSIGSIVSWMSFFIQSVAVSWTAWNLTHSTRWLAIVAVADAIPNVAFMPLGGVVADRYDRFRVLMASYGCAMLQATMLTALALSGNLSIGLLTGLAFFHGCCHAFSIPAQFGLLPRFVERTRLSSAIAVSAAYTQLGIFIGPALAGWVILHFGVAVAFASNVAGYAIFFTSASLLRTPAGYEQPVPSGKTVFADFQEGISAIFAHQGIRAMLGLMAFGDLLYSAIRQMLPAFADKSLGSGVEGFSTLLAAAGIGATISALWLAHGGVRRSTAAIIIKAFIGFLIAITILMGSRGLVVATAAMMGIGCFYEVCRTGIVALLQNSISDHMRGRIMSSQFLLMRLAAIVGVLVIGAIAEGEGLRTPILCCVAFAFAIWTLAYRTRYKIGSSFL